MLSYYVPCVLLSSTIIIALVCLRYVRGHPTVCPSEQQLCLTRLQDVHELLSAQPLTEQIHSRSIPNARLIRAFGITNTFVSDSVDVHHWHAFTREARALLRAAGSKPGDWLQFADCAKDAVQAYLIYAEEHSRAEYEPFVQFVTFSVILSTLFHVDSLPSPQDVLFVTQGINDLWRLSKTTQDMPPHKLQAINAYLRAWIPAYTNPLDYILPTFETMWRVVAIAVALIYKDIDALKTFSCFLACPTSDQFEYFEVDAPSAEAIIAETMRLHPPTRRIHRGRIPNRDESRIHKLVSSALVNFIVVPATRQLDIKIADIGAVHRDEHIWGGDASVFRPLRHHPESLTKEQRAAFMPFGYGRLKCVASSWAPHAAGLVVATILHGLDEDFVIREGCGVGGRSGWEGWKLELMTNDKKC